MVEKRIDENLIDGKAVSRSIVEELAGEVQSFCERHRPPHLVVILVGEACLTWFYPSAEPPLGYSRDNSLSIDGYWYLAEAKSWVQGQEPRVNDTYRQPLISVPAFVIYRALGVSIATSRVLNYLASVGTILLLAALLRRRYGERMALLGALLLSELNERMSRLLPVPPVPVKRNTMLLPLAHPGRLTTS